MTYDHLHIFPLSQSKIHFSDDFRAWICYHNRRPRHCLQQVDQGKFQANEQRERTSAVKELNPKIQRDIGTETSTVFLFGRLR